MCWDLAPPVLFFCIGRLLRKNSLVTPMRGHELEVCGAPFSSFRTAKLLVAFNLWCSNNIQDPVKVNECFLHTKQLKLTSTGTVLLEFVGPWWWFYSETKSCVFMPSDLISQIWFDPINILTPPDHVAAGNYHVSETLPQTQEQTRTHKHTHTSDAITVKWWHQSLAAVRLRVSK